MVPRRYKKLMGNVGLVLFVTFMMLSVVNTGAVMANTTTPMDVVEDVKPGDVEVVDKTVTITYKLEPVTHTSFDTVVATLIWDNVRYQMSVTEDIYKETIGGVTYSVYALLQLVYQLPGSITIPDGFTVVTTVYQVYGVADVVYLDLEIKPPQITPTPTPPPPTPTPAPGFVVSDTAATLTVKEPTVDTATDTSIVSISDDQLKDILKDETVKEVVISMSETVTSGSQVVLSSAAAKDIRESGKTLFVKTGDVTLKIAPNTLKDLDFAAYDEVTFNVQKHSEAEGKDLLSSSGVIAVKGMSEKSPVYEVNIGLKKDDVATKYTGKFAEPLEVAFKYTPAEGDNERKMGAYRLTADGWEYVPSRVNTADNLVIATLWNTSKFTVLLYEKTFGDIAAHWARADIELMASKHIVKGMNDYEFVPDATTTRAQFATMLVRSLGIPLVDTEDETFSDVSKDSWYHSYVETAANAGIVYGYTDGTFKPEDTISRQEMAAMIVRTMGLADYDTSITTAETDLILGTYGDGPKVASWARETSAVASKLGIVRGRAEGVWAPVEDATRAEAAVMIRRMLETLDQM